MLLRHHCEREPDRQLYRHRQGGTPPTSLLRSLAEFSPHLRLELAGDPTAGLLSNLLWDHRL
jgi:hypothetical protein